MTILGAPLLVRTASADCNGPCGGVIFLTTDMVHAAYALTSDMYGASRSRAYIEQDASCVLAEDGSIIVTCEAYEPNHDERCNGVVTFTKDALNTQPWAATAEHAEFMTTMDRA